MPQLEDDRLRALRHVADAERDAILIPDIPADLPVRSIETAAIVGAGTMGGGSEAARPWPPVKRTLYGMINEGARLLERKIALRASDIDIVYVTGYGFPAWRGGPMYYADTIGLDRVYADVERFYAEHGYWWEPAPLLKQLAAARKTFADLDAGRI